MTLSSKLVAALAVACGLGVGAVEAHHAMVMYDRLTKATLNGTVVELQRRTTTGAFVTVAKTVLKDAGTTRSVYSRSLRVRKNGVFLVKVAATPENLEGTSPTRSIRVH